MCLLNHIILQILQIYINLILLIKIFIIFNDKLTSIKIIHIIHI
jgi:hypothetical protein